MHICDNILSFAVTGLGILLCVSLIVFIMLGKSIETNPQRPQELVFKGIRARTNVIIAFLIISLIPAVLPLYLRYNDAEKLLGVTTYETWTLRGQIMADDPDSTTVLIKPPDQDRQINPDGRFTSEIPVKRIVDGRLQFPNFVIDTAGYRRRNIDLDDLKPGGSTFGAAAQKAEFKDAEKSIELGPIELTKERKR